MPSSSTSRPIAEEVVSRLHLNVSTGTLLSRVAIHPLTNTNVLTVSVSWGDAATSAQIANAYASVFVDHQRALIASQADAQVGFLQRALPEAQEHLSAAQNALAAYQQKTGITDLAAQTQSNIATVAALDAKAQSAQLDSRQAAAQTRGGKRLAGANAARRWPAPKIRSRTR